MENVPELRRKIEEEQRRASTASSVFSSVNSQSSLAGSFDGEGEEKRGVCAEPHRTKPSSREVETVMNCLATAVFKHNLRTGPMLL